MWRSSPPVCDEHRTPTARIGCLCRSCVGNDVAVVRAVIHALRERVGNAEADVLWIIRALPGELQRVITRTTRRFSPAEWQHIPA